MPGLTVIASAELERAGATAIETVSPHDRRDDLLLFDAPDIGRVLRCGTLEDVFVAVLEGTVSPRASASAVAATLDRVELERAMLVHHGVRPKRTARSYSVVARMSGRQRFRREDVHLAFERTLTRMLPRWVAREDPTIELWVHVLEGRVLAGIRLTADEFAQRRWKRAHLPASLKPTVARALVLLTEPRAGDIVLDPMCGAGTIVRERAEAGRAARVVAGDIDQSALTATRTNAGRSVVIARWDTTRLPLRDACVDAVICNPPYGRQHEAVAGLPRLMARSLREAARVLRPGGRCVILTGEPAVLQRALPPVLRVRQKQRWLLRGLPVTAFVMVRV